jgi:cell fate (sporulation/competence/biofilm development) regulator YlbF (YheA/YmcA/DUF963 family)
MSTINTILNKLGKIELENHQVNLALVDDLKTIVAKIKSEEGESNKMKNDSLKAKKMFDDAINLKNALQSNYEANKVKYEKQRKESNDFFKKISAQAKELGISINDLPIYKEYLDASNLLNKLDKSNQDNWSLISKY